MNATTSATTMSTSKDLASSLSGGVKAFLAVTFGKEGQGSSLTCSDLYLQPLALKKKDH